MRPAAGTADADDGVVERIRALLPTLPEAQWATDLVLATTVRTDGPGHHTILSRHAQMAVLDLLYVAVAQRTYDQTTEAMAATTEAVRPYKQDRPGADPDWPLPGS
jgi:DNA-binding MurR/RpiR family transcriptional regulator